MKRKAAKIISVIIASVNDPGSKTTLNFSFPLSKDRQRIVPDNYKVYVNYSYAFKKLS